MPTKKRAAFSSCAAHNTAVQAAAQSTQCAKRGNPWALATMTTILDLERLSMGGAEHGKINRFCDQLSQHSAQHGASHSATPLHRPLAQSEFHRWCTAPHIALSNAEYLAMQTGGVRSHSRIVTLFSVHWHMPPAARLSWCAVSLKSGA
jgi:hypothetical protein